MLARGDQIIAVPTLVRRLPTPVKKIIGTFLISRGCFSALIYTRREEGANSRL